MIRRAPCVLVPLVCVAVGSISGCRMLDQYVTRSPRDVLAEAAIKHWAARGAPFFEGVSGRDTVASVSPTGARAWEVAVVPPSGGAPTVWALDLPKIEIYPVFPGSAFAPWLERRARELGMRNSIPPQVVADIRSGQILAVADIEVRYGPADRASREIRERIAYLVPRTSAKDAQWRIRAVTQSGSILHEALETVTDDLIQKNDRVHACMGSPTAAGVSRATQLDCVHDVLERRFGGS